MPEQNSTSSTALWARLETASTVAFVLGGAAMAGGWWVRLIQSRGKLGGVGSVLQLGMELKTSAWVGFVLFMLVILFGVVRDARLRTVRVGYALWTIAGASILIGLTTPVGHTLAAFCLALVTAVWVAVAISPVGISVSVAPRRAVPIALFLLLVVMNCAFPFHRHWSFGSASWDLGCMVHNFYRSSRFISTGSTLLGDVVNHFMFGINLYTPLFWINSSAYMVLFVQAANLAVTGPAIYGIARHHGARVEVAALLGLVTGLAFGMQSAAYFDAHEITVGFGFLAAGIWALEVGRLRLATVLLFVFALFKESLGAYVAALGMLAMWRALKGRDRRLLVYGLAWIIGGTIVFVVVNRYIMPVYIARGKPPLHHETFRDFGPTVFEAMLGILKSPLKAFGALFVPAGAKLPSHAVTLLGTGGLAIASPQILIASAPLIAERFLSSKGEMWEMGYHYAAPLSLYAGWAAARGWARVEGLASRLLEWLGAPRGRAPLLLSVHVLLAAILINAFGYKHPSNFFVPDTSYFSRPEKRGAHRGAIALLDDLGPEAKIAAQNRLLPHVADRQHIYRIGDWKLADYVLLSIGENAWPWDHGLPRRIARQLERDTNWRIIFSKGTTVVFTRAGEHPAVTKDPSAGF